MTGFFTLLGPDFAGKSSVLDRLATGHGWHVVSYDDERLGEQYPLIRRLRHDWVHDAFPNTGERYSAELVVAALHPIVLFLRDEALHAARNAPNGRVIVDSYYYKLLAKCALLRIGDEELFGRWRAFPRPDGVVYLDVPPDVAWSRARHGESVNEFEYDGRTPTWHGFERLQVSLRSELFRELGDVPTRTVSGTTDPATTVSDVLAALADLGGPGREGTRDHADSRAG